MIRQLEKKFYNPSGRCCVARIYNRNERVCSRSKNRTHVSTSRKKANESDKRCAMRLFAFCFSGFTYSNIQPANNDEVWRWNFSPLPHSRTLQKMGLWTLPTLSRCKLIVKFFYSLTVMQFDVVTRVTTIKIYGWYERGFYSCVKR